MMDFRNILAVVLVAACVPYPGEAVPPNCTAVGDSLACYNCARRGDCPAAGDPAEPGTKCATGEACKVAAGVATCMPLSTVPECGCGGATVGCDAYDGDFKIFCVPPGPGRSVYVGENCTASNPNNTCVAGECVAAAATSSSCAGQTTPGFVLSTPTCTAGIFCNGGEEVYTQTCTAGQYFNKAKSACEAYPPNPCAGCTKTKCPIISNCTKYAVCSNGEVADNDESCRKDEFFDPATEACGTTAAGACVEYKDCVFQSTTNSSTPGGSNNTSPNGNTPSPATPTPASPTPATTTTKPPCTSANANQRYPHETNCKKYYTCRLVTRTSYKYIEATCPSTYVFNPTILKCDVISNVPGCQVPAT